MNEVVISTGPPVLDHDHALEQMGEESTDQGDFAVMQCATYKTYTADDGEKYNLLLCGYSELRAK